MRDAAEKLKGELDRIKPMDMTTPVISNVDAEPVVDKNMVMDKLYRQMFSPVLWEATVKRMAKEGVEVFLEVGPQKVLANLIKRTVPDIPCYNIEEIEDIDAIRGIVA